MEYFILISATGVLCFLIFILPLAEALGLFFLLSSFSATKWATPIQENMPFSFIWFFFILYIVVIGLRLKINIFSFLLSTPGHFKLYFILIFFGIFSIAGAMYSLEPASTVKRSLGYIFNAIFFLSFLPEVLHKTTDFSTEKLISYINISFFIPIAIGLFMLFTNSGEVTYLQGNFIRFTGVYGESIEGGVTGNANAAGYFSFILGGISISGLLGPSNKSWKILYFFTAIAAIVSLIASGSRTAVVAFVILLMVLLALKTKTTIRYFSTAFIIILLLSSLGFFNFLKEIIGFESIPVISRFVEFDTSGRTELWKEGLSSLTPTQFLTGFGLGSIVSIKPWIFSGGRMHNIYLELFIETGLIGIVLYLSFIISGAILILRRWKEGHSNEKNFWSGITAFYFALCSHGLSESLLTPANPSFHLLLLCILLTFTSLSKQSNS